MKAPLITVFIAVYNGSRYLNQAIDSILSQTFTDFELLIIDDGSTDNSCEIIAEYTDARITFLKNDTNKGLLFTRNRGVHESKGKYFSILDCDDIALPERLELQYNFFSTNPEVALCGGRAVFIDENNNFLGESPYYTGDKNPLMIFGNILINSTVMINTALVKSIGGYQTYDYAEDYDFALRISEKYPIATLDSILVKYRTHENNTSTIFRSKMYTAEKKILKDFHQRLSIKSNNRIVELHYSFISGNTSCFSLNEYCSFFLNLKESAKKSTNYNSYELDKLIFKKWFELVMFKGGKKALLLLFKRGIYSHSNVTFKQIRKTFKKSLSETLLLNRSNIK